MPDSNRSTVFSRKQAISFAFPTSITDVSWTYPPKMLINSGDYIDISLIKDFILLKFRSGPNHLIVCCAHIIFSTSRLFGFISRSSFLFVLSGFGPAIRFDAFWKKCFLNFFQSQIKCTYPSNWSIDILRFEFNICNSLESGSIVRAQFQFEFYKAGTGYATRRFREIEGSGEYCSS